MYLFQVINKNSDREKESVIHGFKSVSTHLCITSTEESGEADLSIFDIVNKKPDMSSNF